MCVYTKNTSKPPQIKIKWNRIRETVEKNNNRNIYPVEQFLIER
jgi:hypothetical protein